MTGIVHELHPVIMNGAGDVTTTSSKCLGAAVFRGAAGIEQCGVGILNIFLDIIPFGNHRFVAAAD